MMGYTDVRERAGIIDLSSRGRIRVTGSEAIQFLNGMITNDMKTLEVGRWMLAVFPNVQGRFIASVRVIRERDKDGAPAFLLDTELQTHQTVLKNLERFTMAGDFQVTDVTDSTVEFSIQGPDSSAAVMRVLGESVADLEKDGARFSKWVEDEMQVVRATHTGEDGFDLITSKQHGPSLWVKFTTENVGTVDDSALEILRVEAGIPRFGADIDETLVVSETNLDDAVNFTKGCYIGQEIIARIKYRGHVAKKITGVAFDQVVKLESGAIVKSEDDKEVGRLTSVVESPKLGRTVGLALIKYQYLASGTKVKIGSGDTELTARVTDLPFVKGSWYQSERQ
jgi:folate-binding protein YgfZ